LNDGWAVIGQEGDDNDVLLDVAQVQSGVFTLGIDGWNARENRGFVANFDFVGGKGWERHGQNGQAQDQFTHRSDSLGLVYRIHSEMDKTW
jgi:hypothetical protein